MSGFYQGIAGGNGKLIVTALKSPNYDPDEGTGWAINKDGDATFYSVSLPNVSNGTSVTFSGTAPADPSNGDVWYDTDNGLEASVYSGTTGTWVPYQIGTAAIASDTVTQDLLADNSVGTAQIIAESITEALIADNAVGTSQIASDSITNALIAASAVEAENIADGAVGADQIASGAALANIGSGGVTSEYLADGVALENIGDGGITSAYLADGTALANLSPASIDAALLASGTALSNIGSGGITSEYLAADAVTAGAIAADAVTAGTIAAGVVTTDSIAADAITTGLIAAGAVDASSIASGTVVSGIVDGTTIEGATFEGTNWIENSDGIFMYSGTPTTGNLVVSISNTSGTDTYDNEFKDGFQIYGSSGGGLGLGLYGSDGNASVSLNPDTNPWTSIGNYPQVFAIGTGTGSSGYTYTVVSSGYPTSQEPAEIVLYGPSTDGTTSVPHVSVWGGTTSQVLLLDINDTGIAVGDPSSNQVNETPHTASLNSGWEAAASGYGLTYMLMPDNTVQITGRLECTSSFTGGPSTITTMPTGYQPARDEPIWGIGHESGSPYENVADCTVLVGSNGVVQMFGSMNSGQILEISGRYPLNF